MYAFLRHTPAILCLAAVVGCGPDPDLEEAEDAVVSAPACGPDVLPNLLAASGPGHSTFQLRCSLTIPRNADGTAPTITKRILLSSAAASGVRLDCNGARLTGGGDTILIYSTRTAPMTYSRPTDIRIERCTIDGAVRIAGMALNGQGAPPEGTVPVGQLPDLVISSRQDANHTARAQAAAPTRITLSDLTINGVGRIPLYVAPGVTAVRLERSRILGASNSTAIYFDAESANNVLKDNTIAPDSGRELVAIDGSAYNRIIGNTFSHLEDGGVFLYRNCGEGGTVRHQSPVWNQFINNRFFYQSSSAIAINIASRTGDIQWHNPFDFCDADLRGDGTPYPWGSSINDDDLVHQTVIAQNQTRDPQGRSHLRLNDGPNHVGLNQIVAELSTVRSGCFLPAQNLYLGDGESVRALAADGSLICPARRTTCTNGELSTAAVAGACPSATIVPFGCGASGSDAGCTQSIQCPGGTRLAAARAVCNLETADLSRGLLATTPWRTLRVARASDNVSDGSCFVSGSARPSGTGALDLFRANGVGFGCHEHDSNGGDCRIEGDALCVPN